jgi:hypothetical protein
VFGTSPVVPYNESNLYNLYCQAYKKAGLASNIKAHLPRHMLGYLQAKLGRVVPPSAFLHTLTCLTSVNPEQTSKLGWSRNVYMDTYSPALPKEVSVWNGPSWVGTLPLS